MTDRDASRSPESKVASTGFPRLIPAGWAIGNRLLAQPSGIE